MKRAIECFQQAIEKDPDYALAYAGLADSYTILAALGVLQPREVIPKAKTAAMKALELDDTLAEAHTSLALVRRDYDWDWVEAGREFQRACRQNYGQDSNQLRMRFISWSRLETLSFW